MRRASAAVFLAVVCLASCAPTLRQPPQAFTAITSLREDRVIVTVTNLGPSALWLDPNTCPPKFKVEVQERLPSVPTWIDGGRYIIGDTCLTILYPPELWKVGETKVGMLAMTRLPSGTYTVTAWAEPKVAPDVGGKSSDQFQTVRIQAPTVLLTVP
ncbi:hypothetical protein [Deinococcus aluminii]|uniref:Lipoprotein n=1 Tax=Deinococcus aluminii TaxID=1656885 RepID=A0ABP9XFH2_9DEIO